MTIGLALLLFTIGVMLLWLLIFATRKLVITAICRRALRRGDRNHVNDILNEARENAYLNPLDVFQIRQKLNLVKNEKAPAPTRSNYLAAAIRRSFQFRRKSQ